MGGKTAGEKIEFAIGEGQVLRRCERRFDIVQLFLTRLLRDGLQHLRRQVGRCHLGRMAREEIGDMAAAGSQVERTDGRGGGGQFAQRFEIGAARMNGAFDLGFRAGAELPERQFIMTLRHGLSYSPRHCGGRLARKASMPS